jgi:hypothetical protein
MVNPHIKAFIRLFNDTARHHNRYDVFRDFVMMSGISINNALLKSDELEQEYMSIVGRYKKDDAIRIAQLLSEVVMGLEFATCDFLGSVFMELELGSKHLSQFFTPYSVSKCMATISCGDVIDELNDKPFITLAEPCAGAGSMVIAFADSMLELGANPQQQLWVSCVDLDPVAAMMCYLQLSLLHIPGEIITGNTLSMEFNRVMRTPAHYLGFWDSKLSRHRLGDETTKTKSNEELPMAISQSKVPATTGQLALFDVVA